MGKPESILNLTLRFLIMFNDHRFPQNSEIRRDA